MRDITKNMAKNLEYKQSVECLSCNSPTPHVNYIPIDDENKVNFDLICNNCGAEGFAEWNGLDNVRYYGPFRYIDPKFNNR